MKVKAHISFSNPYAHLEFEGDFRDLLNLLPEFYKQAELGSNNRVREEKIRNEKIK